MPKSLVDGVLVDITEDQLTSFRYEVRIRDEDIRNKRDVLLAETNWWANSDRTMTQAQIDYRQALRDITSQAGFPENVTWPTKPE